MTICKLPTENTLCEVLSMTQLYILSQDGTSAINLSQFEYVYIGEDNRIKAVNGQKMIRLGDYAKKHQLKEHRLPAGAAMESVDLTCPFRNEETKRCEVYPVRPLICRAFICSRTLQAARKTRDLVQSDRDIHSLRWEIFKNPESIVLIQAAQRAATKK